MKLVLIKFFKMGDSSGLMVGVSMLMVFIGVGYLVGIVVVVVIFVGFFILYGVILLWWVFGKVGSDFMVI